MTTRIKNARLVYRDAVTEPRDFVFSDKILDPDTPADLTLDADGLFLAPGFIDVHVHGGGGADFMDGGIEPFITATECHLSHGTTSIYPTGLSSTFESILAFLEATREAQHSKSVRANVLGAHLEGPYFSLEQCGAQNPDYIKAPDPVEYRDAVERFGDVIARWSFAPELDGGDEFCAFLIKNGIIPAFAHTNATLEELLPSYRMGARLLTHLYSGMSTISRRGGFRHLGAVESYYYLDDMCAEIIADGKHLPPELLKLIVKQKDTEHLILVTDAMRGAGAESGMSYLGSGKEAVPCIIEDGVAKLLDHTAFAGSVATSDRLVRTMTDLAGLPLHTAVSMVTSNPARFYSLDSKGTLRLGADADLVLFDEKIGISSVFVAGKKLEF